MDGVIADWVAAVEAAGYTVEEIMKSKESKDVFKHAVYPTQFFKNLPTMKGLELVWLLERKKADYAILTAVGEHYTDHITSLKREWLVEVLGFMPEFYAVVHSEDKAVYADEECVLIDDRQKSLVPFKEAGGMTMEYTDENYEYIYATVDLLTE